MASLDELYACYEALNSAVDKSEKKDAYLTVLNGAKSGVNEKRLASQLTARFFKHFPDLHEDALNTLLDLCEDSDVSIRKQAIRDLPTICRECPSYTQRIADILTQLLQVDDAVELRLVEQSLMDLARRDAREALSGILNQLDTTSDDAIRSHAARFIGVRVKELAESGVLSGTQPNAQSNTVDCEAYLAERINETLRKRKASFGGDEFVSLMTALSALRTMQTVNGRAHLVALACEQVVATVPAGVECEPEQLDKLLTCCKLMTPLLSRNVNANSIIEYVCTRILPRFDTIPAVTADSENLKDATKNVDLRLEVLKEFAEVCAFPGRFEPARVDELVNTILTVLNNYLVVPNELELETEKTADDLQLSHVECLLFALHQLGRLLPAFSTPNPSVSDEERERDEKTSEKIRELQKRLNFAARRVQQLRGKLNEAIRTQSASQPQSQSTAANAVAKNAGVGQKQTPNPEDKLKETALRMVNNIFVLIRDLLRFPPIFKATVTLSWKPPPPPIATTPAQPASASASAATTKPKPQQQTKPQSAPSNGSRPVGGQRKPGNFNSNGAQKRPADNSLQRPGSSANPVAAKQPRTAPRPAARGVYQPPQSRFAYRPTSGNGAGAGRGNFASRGQSGPQAGSYRTGPGSQSQSSRGGFRRGGGGGFRGGRY